MGMYNTIHVVIGIAVDREDYDEKIGEAPYFFSEEHDEFSAYNGGELQHDEIVVGKPIFDFSEHAARFDNDPDVHLDLQKVLNEHRQEVSAKLASELDIYGTTSIYLLGQIV